MKKKVLVVKKSWKVNLYTRIFREIKKIYYTNV